MVVLLVAISFQINKKKKKKGKVTCRSKEVRKHAALKKSEQVVQWLRRRCEK